MFVHRVEIRRKHFLSGDRAKGGALCRDIVSALVARERRIPSLEA